MPAGYSGTPLFKKLGIKSGHRFSPIGAPANYLTLLKGLPDDAEAVGPKAQNVDLVHLFVKREADLAKRLPVQRRRMKENGMVWVSWPKKTSGVASDITEDVVRKVAFANKLVDVKVCAVDETWSGLKLVIRVRDRQS